MTVTHHEDALPGGDGMNQLLAAGLMGIALILSGQGLYSSAQARELDLETVGILSQGMTEAEVIARTGQPDRRIDQFEPTPLNQRLQSYQYVRGGEATKGEWTTTVTFSANTNKVIRIDRGRK